MSRSSFAQELEAAADRISDANRADLQILLRRAALLLRNVEGVPLDPAWEDALRSVAVEMKLTRPELIRAIANTYLPVYMLEEDSETDGSA